MANKWGVDSVYLTGWGAHHPSNRLTNDQLVAALDTSHEWLDSRIGIRERRIAVDETVADLGAAALTRAMDSAGVHADELDLVISASAFDDHDVPSSAARIAAQVGVEAFTFDVSAACSGWLVGLEVAAAMIAAGRAQLVAVCAAEKTSIGVDPDDRASRPFFGDAAAATIVSPDRPDRGLEVVAMARHSDNDEHDAVIIPRGGFFRMDGHRTRTWVEKAIAGTAAELLEGADLAAGDLRGLVCHQANLRLLERIAADLGVAPDHHWHNVEWAGNTSAAGAPTALAEALDDAGGLDHGDHVLVVTVGGGLNVVGALLRWVGEQP